MQKKIDISENELYNRLSIIYNSKEKIHISIHDGRLKVDNAESIITGIYKHFICVDSIVKSYNESFTIKIVDIKIGKVKILELGI